MTHKSIRLIVTVVLIILLVTYCISGAVNSTQAQIRTYVANDCNGMVSVIDSTSNTVVNTISVGISPIDIAITPDGTRAYLTDRTTGTVSVIDTGTNTVIASIPLSPVSVA
jgi:YVTN family beta-propeller protein